MSFEHLYRVDPSGCWLWLGRLDKDGKYGRWSGGRLAHRLMYERVVGEIPEGMELDHLCFQPLCVNPTHLEPVTRPENIRRRYALVTHCSHGHPFDEANTRRDSEGRRSCRTCEARRSREYQQRKRGTA